MNDPRRLLDGGGDPLEAELLRSAWGDAPPREGKARLLGAMGLAGAATTAAGAGTASGAMSGAKGVLAVAGKWVVLGGMGAAVAAGTVHVARPFIAPTPPPVVAQSQTPRVTKIATPSVHAPPSPRSVDSTPPAIAPPAMPAPRATPTPTPAPVPRIPARVSDDDMLAEELPYIDRARRSLAEGEPADAILALNTYELHFTHPRLAEEAQVLRIEALMRLGKTDQARSVADSFLRADPASPYAKRVQSLLHQSDAQ
jgi:hypothetical protein